MANRRRLPLVVVPVLGTLFTVAVGAQTGQPPTLLPDAELEEQEPRRRYTVEVIVFEYAELVGAGNEIFEPERPPADDIDADDAAAARYGDAAAWPKNPLLGPDDPFVVGVGEDGLPEPLLDPLADDGAVPARTPEEIESATLTEIGGLLTSADFRVLTPEERTMTGIHERLIRLDAYQPVFWGGWTQAALDADTALPISLRRIGPHPLSLQGTLKLYLQNYLHLVIDLSMEQQISTVQRDPVFQAPDQRAWGRGTGYGVVDTQTIRYAIAEDRIFRSGELRYFDHPKFGVLARIVRVEDEAPEGDEESPAAPAGSRQSPAGLSFLPRSLPGSAATATSARNGT